MLDAGIARIVVATLDPNPLVQGKGIEALRNHGLQVEIGLLEQQARQLNRGFIQRMQSHRPWITVKSAATLDGRTALENGESKWITNTQARQDVQYLRARHDAVLTGIGTVLSDNPSLNVRLTPVELAIEGEIMQPLRVVLDTHLKISKQAKLLSLPGNSLIYSSLDNATNDLQNIDNCEVAYVKTEDEYLCLNSVLGDLAKREINSVLVEAGSRLAGALFKNKLVDEFVFYIAPKLFGSNARGLLDIGSLSSIDDHIALDIKDVRNVGNDLRITALVN